VSAGRARLINHAGQARLINHSGQARLINHSGQTSFKNAFNSMAKFVKGGEIRGMVSKGTVFLERRFLLAFVVHSKGCR